MILLRIKIKIKFLFIKYKYDFYILDLNKKSRLNNKSLSFKITYIILMNFKYIIYRFFDYIA